MSLFNASGSTNTGSAEAESKVSESPSLFGTSSTADQEASPAAASPVFGSTVVKGDRSGGRRASKRGGKRSSKRGGKRSSKRGGSRASKRGGKRSSRRGGSRTSRR